MFMLFGFLINILFLNFNNPLILGILMMLQTLNLIMMMGKIYYSFWFSYIIFLVMIGGLFILFIYVITLVYNSKHYYYFNFNSYFLIIMLFFILFKSFWYFNNHDNNLMNLNFNNQETFMNMMKLYNFPNCFINLMLVNYLLLVMIIVVKITNFSKGPIKSL